MREALRQLESEGLVQLVPYRGAVVIGVCDEEVQEVLIPIRLTLERFSFRRALERLTDDDFAEIAKQVWLMDEAAAHRRPDENVEADLRFHEIVLPASGHPHTVQMCGSIWPRIRALLLPLRPRHRTSRRWRTSTASCSTALQTRDPKLVLEMLERHIAVPSPRRVPSTERRHGKRSTPEVDGGRRMTELLTSRPPHVLPHAGRPPPRRRRRRLLDRRRADARHRRRVRQRQVGDRALDHGPDRPPGRIEPGSIVSFDGRNLADLDDDAMTKVRGNDISMIFQEPMTSLNPVFTVGDQIAEAVRLHQGRRQAARRTSARSR